MKRVGKIIMGLGGLIGGITVLGEAFAAGASLADSNPGKQLPNTKKKTDMTVTRHAVRGIDDRLKYIIAKIRQGKMDPRVRQFAVQAVSKKCGEAWCTPEKNWEAEVDTMFNVVRQHVRYVRDTYGVDLYQAAKRTIQFGGGDCDDYTITLGALLQAIGYPVKCRVIQTVDSDDWNHIYLLCGLPPRGPTKWKVLDASMDKPAGWECPKRMIAKMRDFMVD